MARRLERRSDMNLLFPTLKAAPPIPTLWHIALYERGKINRSAHVGGTAYYGRGAAAILAAAARSPQRRKACTARPARAIPAGERLRREAI